MTRVALTDVSLEVMQWPGPAKGPAIVCVHGLTANHTCWASIADVLSPAPCVIPKVKGSPRAFLGAPPLLGSSR